MCARYTLRAPAGMLAERFGLAQVPYLVARYNIAPSQPIPVVGTEAGGRGVGACGVVLSVLVFVASQRVRT